MATQLVKLRRSAAQGAIPTTGQLELGELALNTYDGKVYMKKNVGGTESVVQVGITNYPDSQTLSFGTDSDLIISHDGFNSIINQTGTGTLQVQVDESTVLDISSAGLDVTGALTLTGSLTLDDTQLVTNSTTTTSTAETTVASFAAATYRTNKHVVQITDSVSGEYHAVEILVIHDGTDAYKTEYAEITTGAAALASFDVDISAGNVRLLATPASANSTTFKVVTQNTKV